MIEGVGVMRAIVSVDGELKVTVACEGAGGWSASRQLRRSVDPAEPGLYYPLPPASEAEGGWDEGDFAEIHEAHRRLADGLPEGDDMDRFGAYLFRTLIGGEVWEEVRKSAGGGLIELALSWPRDQVSLHRLHWEMMRGSEGFLAEGRPLPVAITRRVAGTSGPEPSPIDPPPRVLFVVCVPLTDAKVRAGAEAMGLIRQLSDAKGGKRRGIQTRILLGASKTKGATPGELSRAVRAFRPDVVHFIGHGAYDEVSRQGYVVMGLDAGEPPGAENRSARFLLDHLKFEPAPAGKPGRAPSMLPRMIVLATCHSAEARAGHLLDAGDTAPLAAELVEGGVPVVVGMGGRISDTGCRLFTRQFGASLVGKDSLASATACGRAAALSVEKASESVHWAYPTVFMAESVPAGFVPVGESGQWANLVEGWIEGFRLKQEPVFCGREDIFEAFYRLFEGAESVLAVRTPIDSEVGRTRLLHEMVTQLLREGHIPCLVSEDNPESRPQPASLGEVALKLFKAMQDTRDVLQIRPPDASAILDSLRDAGLIDDPTIPDAVGFIRAYRKALDKVDVWLASRESTTKNKLKIGAYSVRLALRDDFERLANDVRAAYPEMPVTGGRLVVLLDDLHLYDKLAVGELVDRVLGERGAYGFGGSSEARVPVIAVYKEKVQEVAFDPFPDGKPGFAKVDMGPFAEGGEHVLATGRILLFQTRPNPAWAINASSPEDVADFGEAIFFSSTDGLPGGFTKPKFYKAIDWTRKKRYLVPADDDKILAAFAQRMNGAAGVGP